MCEYAHVCGLGLHLELPSAASHLTQACAFICAREQVEYRCELLWFRGEDIPKNGFDAVGIHKRK